MVNFVYPCIEDKIKDTIDYKPALKSDIYQMEMDHVINLLHQCYIGFGDSSKPTLLKGTQLTALINMSKAAKDNKIVMIKLGAGEGKTWLSKQVSKIFPDLFTDMPIIHVAPFPQSEDGWEKIDSTERLDNLENNQHYWIQPGDFMSLLDSDFKPSPILKKA